MAPVIGIDFDNTIVCCDDLFFSLAREMGFVPQSSDKTKNAVRDHIRLRYSDEHWTRLQAEVYGHRLLEAKPYPGVIEFFLACREQSIVTHIISHKSQYPADGPPYDFHEAALRWLSENGFFPCGGAALSFERVAFAPTRKQKIEEVRARGCDVFVDDLPEVFSETDFPAKAKKILFDPHNIHSGWIAGARAVSWDEIHKVILYGSVSLD